MVCQDNGVRISVVARPIPKGTVPYGCPLDQLKNNKMPFGNLKLLSLMEPYKRVPFGKIIPARTMVRMWYWTVMYIWCNADDVRVGRLSM